MNFCYSISPERRIVFQRYEGAISLAQILVCIQRVWADPAYDRSFSGYIDLTHATPNAAFSDLNALIEFLHSQPHTSVGRCAAVTSSPVLTACGLLYQKAMAHHHAFAIFSTDEAARAFLQLEARLPDWNEESIEKIAV